MKAAELTAMEIYALKAVSEGHIISAQHRDKLLRLGLIRSGLRRDLITWSGQLRLWRGS
jgi:hypothetical protein